MLKFDGARDVDGDGAIEVSAGAAASSRIRQSRLSAIWVFPEGTKIDKPESVVSGAMKDKCVHFIDVGATPEQDYYNQTYNKSDVSFAFMRLDYAETVPPGQTKTYWLRVPPVHRRQPVSMHYVATCLPRCLARRSGPALRTGEGQDAPETGSPAAERQVADYWAAFFATRRDSRFPIRSSTTCFFHGWLPGQSST